MSDATAVKVGLIGWPVAHSVSPAMHNAAFAALGLAWRYESLAVQRGDLDRVVRGFRTEGWRGANVTVPHKQAVIGQLDEVDGTARRIGAVNTIVVRDGALVGTNTDAAGAMEALREGGFAPEGKRALVLGAGGAARAVVHGLATAECSVILYNRTVARAAALARHARACGSPVIVASNLADLDLGTVDLLVNATSVGMVPDVEASPWPETLPVPAHWTVFDLVYNPAETRLLARARAAGAHVVGGLTMLVHQGALAFELWTGEAAPVDVMHAAARQAVAAMHGQKNHEQGGG